MIVAGTEVQTPSRRAMGVDIDGHSRKTCSLYPDRIELLGQYHA